MLHVQGGTEILQSPGNAQERQAHACRRKRDRCPPAAGFVAVGKLKDDRDEQKRRRPDRPYAQSLSLGRLRKIDADEFCYVEAKHHIIRRGVHQAAGACDPDGPITLSGTTGLSRVRAPRREGTGLGTA